MSANLPDGFVLDQPAPAASLPAGFVLDKAPTAAPAAPVEHYGLDDSEDDRFAAIKAQQAQPAGVLPNKNAPESSWLETGLDTMKQVPASFQKAVGGIREFIGHANVPEDKAFNDHLIKLGQDTVAAATATLQANAPNVVAGSGKDWANKLGLGIAQTIPAMGASFVTGSAMPLIAQAGGTSFGNTYADEITKNPNDPDGAATKATAVGVVNAAATAIGIKAFGIQPFTSAMGKITNEATGEFATVYRQTIGDMIKNVMVQGVAIQPAISVVNSAVDNWINGKPITEGLSDAYITGAIQNTLVMGITHLATRPPPTMGKVQGGEPGPGFGEGPIIDGNVTPPGRGPAPAGGWGQAALKLGANVEINGARIDPRDIHEGDAESPIDTSIIAAGRKIQREALQKQAQASESAGVLARNGLPSAGTRVTLDDGEQAPLTGTVHSGYSEPHPDVPGAMADGIQVQLDSGDMLRGFKHDLDAAGITITPQQAQQAGLPLDVATQPTNQPQPQTVAATPSPAATATQPEIAPAQVAPQAASQDMAVINGNAAPISAVQQISNSAPSAEITPPILRTPAPETVGDGTQSAPIVVTHPDHLATAEANVNTSPTEAQAAAGNYEHGHVKVQGLNIAIENPKGSVRRGVDADGKPWEVALPASYGYIKRSTAADGEQVDAYVGPNPQSSKVFVIDQRDAKTGAYDEAKSFIGFDTKQQVLDTYHAAFSDGLGPQRMGGVREMNTLQFKKLLNSGVLDKPIAPGFANGADAKEITTSTNETGPSRHDSAPKEITTAGPSGAGIYTAPDEVSAPKPILKTPRAQLTPSTETSVLENIRRMGGIKTTDANGQPTKEGQDIQAVLKDVNRPGLINNQTGQRPDTIREHMQQHGWFGQTGGHDIQDLYDLIDKEVRSGPQFHPESERGKAVAAKAEAESSERGRADAHAELDHFIKESKELFSTADRAALHEQVDGGFDPLSAVVEHIERRAMREQYEHHAETADQDYAASLEPDRERAGEVAGRRGESVEGHPPVATSEGNRDEAGGTTAPPVGAPSEARQSEVKAEPGTAVDGQGKAIPQTVIPGADHTAAQLAAAREAQGHGRATTSVTQKDAGGMFEPKVEEAPDLFGNGDRPKFQAPTRQTNSPAFKAWFGDSKVVDEEGNPVRVYHGTARPDRIGDRFRKTRATSGPMSFFTEDPELASSYSTAKQDTSLYNEDQNYGGWYKVKVGRSAVPIDRLWNYLTPEDRAKIASLAPRVGRDFETGENIILHPEGEKSGLGGYDQHLKEARGDYLKALVDEWLNSGALFNDEGEFAKVLKLAGLDRPVQDDFPHASYPAVLPAYLSIKNPLDTGSIPPAVVDALNRAASRQRRAPEAHGADLWAKNSRSAREWMGTLQEGLARPDSNHAFTSIPDWVTKTLKELGYDGIKDVGGKLSGGKRHNVWIPFEETQVKSATGNRGTFDPNNPRISFSRSKDNIARGTFTDKFDNERPAVAAELRARLNAMGLHDIALKLPDGIEFNGDKMEGAYARKIVAIAMSAENRAGTMDHEAIHAIKDMGLFTKSEWSMLSAKAAKDWRGEFNIDSRYADLSEDARNEEAIAEAFQAWREAPKPARGFFTRIFNKVRDALSAIRRVLTGRGYETTEDIFAGIGHGEVGARERGNYDAADEAKFSRSEGEAEDDHQAAIDNAWDTLISSTAKRMGWEGEPTSQAMGLKALLMPKGPEKTELARNARAIKALEDQRANPLGTHQAPIQGDGETKVRGTAQSMADKAAKSGIALEDLPTYDVSHHAPFIERSEKFDAIPTNRATAEAVAMGREPAPYGTTAESMLIAVERRANREGDAALLLKLATQSKVLSDLTTAGQRISMMQNLDPLSPVVAIKAVRAAREKAAKVKGGGGPKAKKDTIKDMMDAINKQSKRNPKGEPMGAAAKKLKWQLFVNGITCK